MITHTGVNIVPAIGEPQNFTKPVTYTVTAADGSHQNYVVTVIVGLDDAKEITAFTLNGTSATTISSHDIYVTLPYGAATTSLTPNITHTGMSISPMGPQDFSSLVLYTVTAEDEDVNVYTVHTTVARNYAKEITEFSVAGVSGTRSGYNISVTLPYGSSVDSLTPSITTTGASISPESGVAQDFTDPVTYTVTAADGTSQDYLVTVTPALNPAKEITEFSVAGVSGTFSGTDIYITIPYLSSAKDRTPTISYTGASISPAIGVAKDFTDPVTYTVTAADGTHQHYVVTVTVAFNPAKEITEFSVAGVLGTISGTNISVTLPYGSSVDSLTPSITSTGASINPSASIAQDFSDAVTYTVTAADSTHQDYLVTVIVALNPAKEITEFSVAGVLGTISGTNISVTLPYGSSVDSLTPSITSTGASINPSASIAQDFSDAVTYTVTAADGTHQHYVVTVTVAFNPAKEITEFSVAGVLGTISGTNISVTLPYGSSVDSLTPSITSTGASINPSASIAQDFSDSVTYTVTAADGTSQDYLVTVIVALNPAKEITAFSVAGVSGRISGTNVSITLPYGSSIDSLTPSITSTGASINPSASIAQDFSDSVTYTVTAADGTHQHYVVTVIVALNPAKEITEFSVAGSTGVIGGTTIAVTVPFGTEVTSLTPSITSTGASISPSASIAQNFSEPVTYTVTAADGTHQHYVVTVTVAFNPEKEITAFAVAGSSGVIDGLNIAVTVPYGTSVTSLTPSITQTGADITPAIGVAQNFTDPITYRVTAADSTYQDYVVTVTVARNPAKAITVFSVASVAGTISGLSISIQVPYDTPVTSVTPSITHTGESISPAVGVAQNFTSPVLYTVTAANGTSQTYTVTVAVAEPNYALRSRGPAGGWIFKDKGSYSVSNGINWRYAEAAPAIYGPAVNWYQSMDNCANYAPVGPNGKTYDDWYLPLRAETTDMYNQLYLNKISPMYYSPVKIWSREIYPNPDAASAYIPFLSGTTWTTGTVRSFSSAGVGYTGYCVRYF